MRLGYGLVTCQRHPDDPRDDVAVYRDAIERCAVAEQNGFDSVWVSEHHFVDDGYMPSLLVTCAAIAQATETVEIGTGILLAPLHHPLRVAEDAATVDLISGGRFICGLGAGWREEEFELLGTGLDERVSRVREMVEVLRLAWSDEVFDFDGPHHSFKRASVTPKPAHPIPIWLGGFADGAIRRAGRIADGFLGSSTGTQGVDAFVRARDIALEARRAAGRDPDDFSFALHVPVFAWDGEDAWEVVKPWYHYLRWKYPDMGAARGRKSPSAPPPELSPEAEERLRSTIICGTPEEVADGIRRYRDVLGDDTLFICRSDFPGLPQGAALRTIELIGERVAPELT